MTTKLLAIASILTLSASAADGNSIWLTRQPNGTVTCNGLSSDLKTKVRYLSLGGSNRYRWTWDGRWLSIASAATPNWNTSFFLATPPGPSPALRMRATLGFPSIQSGVIEFSPIGAGQVQFTMTTVSK